MSDKLASILTHYTWDLAYFDCYDQDFESLDIKALHYIKNPYKNKWFADPFILDVKKNEFQLLVEEYDNSIKRGRIARLAVDKQRNVITECKIVLDLPTHLSFPAIYRIGTQIIVHPENSASGASYMYTYDIKSDSLVDPICVLNEPVTDAIIRKEGEALYMMLATCVPNPNGDILRYYTADSLMGPYSFFKEEVFENNTARMAGYIFQHKDKIIRPAQDCYGSYGKAVLFYDGHQVLGRLSPIGIKYCGIHTYNTCQGIGIVDLKKWDYPFLIAVKDVVKKIIR